jgi:hypothetical protein
MDTIFTDRALQVLSEMLLTGRTQWLSLHTPDRKAVAARNVMQGMDPECRSLTDYFLWLYEGEWEQRFDVPMLTFPVFNLDWHEQPTWGRAAKYWTGRFIFADGMRWLFKASDSTGHCVCRIESPIKYRKDDKARIARGEGLWGTQLHSVITTRELNHPLGGQNVGAI